jgi:copper(I)-binding protein
MRYIAFILCFLCLATHKNLEAQEKNVVIDNAWVRKTQSPGQLTALYFSIENLSHNTEFLTAITTKISDKIYIQKSIKINGMVKSTIVAKVAIPGKTKIEFAPLGISVFMHNIQRQLVTGEVVEFTFYFSNSSPQKISAHVR